jgi:hypothetical protein
MEDVSRIDDQLYGQAKEPNLHLEKVLGPIDSCPCGESAFDCQKSQNQLWTNSLPAMELWLKSRCGAMTGVALLISAPV